MKQRFWQAVAFSVLILLPLSSEAARQITDQIGRTVTIPDKVDRGGSAAPDAEPAGADECQR